MVSMDNLHLSDAWVHSLNCQEAIPTCQPLGGNHVWSVYMVWYGFLQGAEGEKPGQG